jgi:xylulokinase
MGRPADHLCETVLCCDVGGSSLRVGLVDARGAVMATAARALTIAVDADGYSDVEPDLWWKALGDLVASLAGENPAALGRVVGISICGMTRTQVLVDGDGNAVRPAITWRDSRAGAEAAGLAATYHGEGIDAYHPAARLAWVERHEPRAFAKARYVLDPKDYLALRLTGRPVSDRISLARLQAVVEAGRAVARYGALLPLLLQPSNLIAHVGKGLPPPFGPLAGCPVFMASNDTWTAVLGLGALQAGVAYNILGTSEVLGLIANRPATAQGLMSVDWGEGLHQIGGPSQNGGDVIPWLARVSGVSGQDPAASLSHALSGERYPQPLLFLPFLQGERVPYWDPDLRGGFLGLSKGHRPVDLAWAVLEGAAFAARVVLERAEEAAGGPAQEIRFGGGGSRNEVWCQLRADLMRRTVVVGAADEPGLLGCAAVAWTGLGLYNSLAQAQETLARPHKRYEPRSSKADDYDELYTIYQDAVSAVAPISRRLATLRSAKGLMPAGPR